jgi:exopolysaccharide production protein ExoQ
MRKNFLNKRNGPAGICLSPESSMRPHLREKPSQDNPKLPDSYAIPCVALTTLIMAYSGLFSTLPILILYILWLPRLFYKGQFILRPSAELLMPLALVFYCLLSTLWSDYPAGSLHNALEFISMLLCMIIMSRIVSIEAFVKGLIVGVVMVFAPLFLSGTYAAEGLFASKNQVGLFAEVGLFAIALHLFRKSPLWEKIVFRLFPFVFFSACLVFSHSGASDVTLVLVLGIIYAARFADKFSPRRRKSVLATVIIFAAIIAAIGIYMGEQDTLLRVMGKDTTLTGRTYLWSEGIKNGFKNPVLGDGYNAFWVQGRPEAEKYWYEFYIFGRGGFHFHNIYIQTFVDLGGIGLAIMAYMVFSYCFKSYHRFIAEGANLNTLFCLGASFMLMIRGFVEVDYLGPFSIGALLFFSLPLRLSESLVQTRPEKPAKGARKRSINESTQTASRLPDWRRL